MFNALTLKQKIIVLFSLMFLILLMNSMMAYWLLHQANYHISSSLLQPSIKSGDTIEGGNTSQNAPQLLKECSLYFSMAQRIIIMMAIISAIIIIIVSFWFVRAQYIFLYKGIREIGSIIQIMGSGYPEAEKLNTIVNMMMKALGIHLK